MDAFPLFEWTYGRWLLVFLRISLLLVMAPFYGLPNVPARLRLGLAAILAFAIAPTIAAPEMTGIGAIFLLGLKEAAVGVLFGLVLSVLFAAAQTAGHLTGLQMGLGLANMVDPLQRIQMNILGQVYHLIAMLLFLAVDGHHFILQALVHSFDVVPIDGWSLTTVAVDALIRQTANVFLLAIQLAAPVMGALLATSAGLGLVARTVPQMNVFIVGFPVKIGLGFLVMWLSLPFFGHGVQTAWNTLQQDALSILAAVGS